MYAPNKYKYYSVGKKKATLDFRSMKSSVIYPLFCKYTKREDFFRMRFY